MGVLMYEYVNMYKCTELYVIIYRRVCFCMSAGRAHVQGTHAWRKVVHIYTLLGTLLFDGCLGKVYKHIV